MKILETERLILRTFKKSDIDRMTEINQDPGVMAHFPGLINKAQTQQFIEKISNHQDKYGYSLFAVELKENGHMIGFIGLLHRTKEDLDVSFTPATEIGWRLDSNYWGRGYATEGAKAVLDYAFNQLKLPEIVSFTVPNNKRSIKLMERIGLKRDHEGDFNHTQLPKESPFSRHILYRLSCEDYQGC